MRRTLAAAVAAGFLCLAILASAEAQTPSPAAAPAITALDALPGFAGASAAAKLALQKALALVDEGKWRSAMTALDAFDPSNADPYALAMKTKIYLDGFIRSEAHVAFALKDLAEGEDVASLRMAGEEGELVAFDPQALADAQAAVKAAVPAILSKELGDYYYDLQMRWSGQTEATDEELYGKSLANYEKAYAGQVFDAESLQNQAEILMRFDRNAEAEPLFAKSVELDPMKAASRYNYAICLVLNERGAAAYEQIDAAIDLLPPGTTKLQALALGARAAADAGDAARSEGYLALADALFPGDPTPLLLRHFVAVEHRDSAAAAAAADKLMATSSADPGIVRNLLSTWYQHDQGADAQAFLERTIAKQSDELSLGTLKFYLAVVLSQGEITAETKAKALALLDETEAHMKKASPDDQGVFDAIKSIRDRLAAAP